MDIFPKFIIETDDELGDCLIISKCTYHKDLVTDASKVKGGGSYKFNKETNSITFSGQSYDFGPAKLKDIKACIHKDLIFTNPILIESIAKDHNFFYDTGTELIILAHND